MSDSTITKNYKCVFFDLDHTLWDYEKNAAETLSELYEVYNLSGLGIPDALSLYHKFREINLSLWDLYDNNRCDQHYIRTERFKQILTHFSAYDAELSEELSTAYLGNCPRKNNLMPYAIDMLEYLQSKYQLTVVTNGFEDIQNTKLSAGNLHRFFKHVVTSQKSGYRKPSGKMFEYAMKLNDVTSADVIMIGDNLVTDIGGAKSSAIDAIFFNRDKVSHQTSVDHEISCLSELKNIL